MRNTRGTRRRGVPVAILAGVALLVGACADDETLVSQKTPPTSVDATVPVNRDTLDGQRADPVLVTAVVNRILDPSLEQAPLGAATVRRFYSVQLLALGFDEQEAACAADELVKAAGPDIDTLSMADLTGTQAGIDQTAMANCVDPARLAELQNQPPDPQQLAGIEVRALLADQSTATMRAAGLTDAEAICVTGQTIGVLTEDEVGDLHDGVTSSAGLMPDAVAGCLTADRLVVLAEG